MNHNVFDDVDYIFSTLSSKLNLIICSYNMTNNQWKYVNEPVKELCGFTSNEIIKKQVQWISQTTINEITDEFHASDLYNNSDGDFLERYILIEHRNGKSLSAFARILFIFSEDELQGFFAVIDSLNYKHPSLSVQHYIETLQLTSHRVIIIFDKDGYVRNVNDRTVAITGFSRNELLGKYYLDFAEPHYQDSIKKFKNDVDNDITSIPLNLKVRKKDGFLFNAQFLATAIRNQDGKIEAYVVAGKEVLIDDRIVQKLRVTHDNLHGLLEAILDNAGILDTDLNFLTLNNAAALLFDSITGKNDYINSNFLDYVSEEKKEFFLKKRDEILMHKKKQSYGVELYGRSYNLIVYPLFDEEGEVNRLIGFAKDITEEVIISKKLRKSEIRYQQIVDNMYEGLIITDSDLTIIYVNNKVLIKTDLPESFFIGQNILFMVNSDEKKSMEKYMEEAIETGETQVVIDIDIPNKELLTIMFSVCRIFDEDDIFEGLQLLVSDVTSVKRYERQLENKNKYQELAVDISTDFISYENSEIDNGIVDALKKVGMYNNEKLIFVMRFNDNKSIIYNTHLWYSDDYELQKKEQFILDLTDYPLIRNQIVSGEILQIPNLDLFPFEIPDALKLAEKNLLKSLLLIPLKLKDNLIGLLGFASSIKKNWSEDALSLYKMIGSIFVNAIEKKRISNDLIKSIMSRLSDREKEFLLYLIEGYEWPSDKRLIGKKMDVLPGTLDRFMSRIKEKVRNDELDSLIDTLRFVDLNDDNL